ncbi:MAG: Hint domain-containing protein [Maritimibacter sp.]
MTNYYIVSSNPDVHDDGNINNYTQILAGAVTPQEGDAYYLDGDLSSSLWFYGSANFTVNIEQSLVTNDLVGGATMWIQGTTNATVNIAAGVDADYLNISSTGDTLSVNVGDEATLGAITAPLTDQMTIVAGNTVTMNGALIGSNGDSTVTFGSDATFNSTVNFDGWGTLSETTSQTFSVGDNAIFEYGVSMDGSYTHNSFSCGVNSTIGGDIVMNGSGYLNTDGDTSGYSGSVTIGDGSTVQGNVYMGGNYGDMNVAVGNDVTVGDIAANGSFDDIDITVGNGSDTGYIGMGGSDIAGRILVGSEDNISAIYAGGSSSDICVGVGDNTNIDLSIAMGGSNDTYALTLGDGVSVGLDLSMGGSNNVQNVVMGDDVSVGTYVFMGGVDNTNHVEIGNNFTLGSHWTGSVSGSDYLQIGDNWDIGTGIYLQGGDDTLILGTVADGVTAYIDGGLGTDALSLRVAAGDTGFVTAATEAGWTYDSDSGTWSSNGNDLTYNGVTYTSFETAAVVDEDWELVCPLANNIVDGTAGDDVMDIGYTDAQGDQIDGTDGETDVIFGYAGDDTINGGAGNDTIHGGLDNDNITGGAGDDTVTGGAGSDTLAGGAGADVLDGGSGDDSLDGGEGNDELLGGLGADTLTGGAGADTLTGGDGADLFLVDDGGDTVTDFDAISGIGNDDESDNDVVDLSPYYNETTLADWNAANPTQTYNSPLAWLRADQSDGVLDAAGGLELYSPDGNPVTATDLNAENTRVICFARGTRIVTPRGEVEIQNLKVGDKVLTLDNGFKPIRWIGHRKLEAEALDAVPKLRPIRIRAGALDNDLPVRDLVVSPQHRVLYRSPHAELMFGTHEVLLAARQLLDLEGVSVEREAREVEYWHFLFDRHEIVFAEGAASESLFTGVEALKSLSPEAREEIFALFPELAADEETRKPVLARPMVNGAVARLLVSVNGRGNTADILH